MAGLLNVCHGHRAPVVCGQWLAAKGGRHHVHGSYNVVWAGGWLCELGERGSAHARVVAAGAAQCSLP